MAGNSVDIIESFTYFGSLIDHSEAVSSRAGLTESNRTGLHATAGSQDLVFQHIRIHQALPLLCICPACLFVET